MRREQFLKGRSYCESCKHKLYAKDLVPLLSFIVLKGRCRYCKKPIPWMLFVIELTVGIVFTSIFYYDLSISASAPEAVLNGFLLFVLAALLILIFFTDLKHEVIPDLYLYGLLAIYLIYYVLVQVFQIPILNFAFLILNFYSHLFGALWLFAFFGFLHLAFEKKAMGEGDIYLAAILGLFLGLKLSVVMWFVAFISGALVGVFLLVSRKKRLKQAVPFGPFLVFGFVAAVLFGRILVGWYLSVLLRV